MLKHYFKVAFRNLLRNKTISFLNIIGLALAISCSILIYLWVQDETSFDSFHENGNNIYQVVTEDSFNDVIQYGRSTPYPLGKVISGYAHEIKYVIRFNNWFEKLSIRYGDKNFNERVTFTDPAFFQTFTFPFVEGDEKTAFEDPLSVVITEEIAKKYFGDSNPLGKNLQITSENFTTNVVVRGVIQNLPHNSSLDFDFLLPISLLNKNISWINNWGTIFLKTFLLLEEGAIVPEVISKIENVPSEHHDWNYKLFLQPFKDLRLYEEFKENRTPTGRIVYINLFSIIAIAIILIGCINFTNLYTAFSSRRAKEIGLRKVMGAHRKILFNQFLGEAILMSSISLALALSIIQLSLPFFNALTEKQIVIPYNDVRFLLMLGVMTISSGVLAGIYPSLVLSSFNPIMALKSQVQLLSDAHWLRKGLVIFQLVVTTVLIISTIIIYQQISFINHKNLGIDTDNVIYFPVHQNFLDHHEAFENEILQSNHIQSFTLSSSNPLMVFSSSSDPTWEGKTPDNPSSFYFIECSYDILETMGIKLIKGRTFDRSMKSDTASFMVNKEAAKLMGVDDPIGLTMSFWDKKGKIIGLVENFHHQSMHSKIGPMILRFWPENTSYGFVKFQGQELQKVIKGLEATYNIFEPDYPFEYYFLNKDLEEIYNSEKLVSKFSNLFSFLAIMISCLGLYGLIAYTTEKKSKEIGIRKVLGASVKAILLLLSSTFMKWVLVANLIAWPIAWYVTNAWLENFAYRIEISWWVFAATGLITFILTLSTLSFKTIRSALANPVESLKYE